MNRPGPHTCARRRLPDSSGIQSRLARPVRAKAEQGTHCVSARAHVQMFKQAECERVFEACRAPSSAPRSGPENATMSAARSRYLPTRDRHARRHRHRRVCKVRQSKAGVLARHARTDQTSRLRRPRRSRPTLAWPHCGLPSALSPLASCQSLTFARCSSR
jgi:hypothetical protein